MHRIDTSTAQSDKFGTGKNGFTDGNPTTGRRATDLNADMWDAVQEEICNTIEGAEIELNKSSHTQLFEAIKSIINQAALLIANNLSDLKDKGAARNNLGLGTLATKNSLSYSDVGAFPAVGGTVGANGVKTPGLLVNNHTMVAASQGVYTAWNETNGGGEGVLICNKGTGTGGFVFRTVNSDNTVESGRITIGGDGDLNTTSTISEMGQRVYSPNNPPSQLSGSGWFKDVATGFIIQWGGAYNSSTNSETHNFNITFPNACVAVVATLGTGVNNGNTVYTSVVNTTGFDSKTSGTIMGFSWIALGY